MVRVFLFGFRHPLIVLIAAVAATILAVVQIGDLRVDVSTDVLAARGSPERGALDALRERFGEEEVAAVFVEDAELFTSAKIEQLYALSNSLAALPFVTKCECIFTIDDLRVRDGALDYSAVLQEPLPATDAEAKAAQSELLSNPLLKGSIISADGKATLFILHLVAGTGNDPAAAAEIARILSTHEGQFQSIFQLGEPTVHAAILRLLRKDVGRLMPAAVLILFLILSVAMRSLLAGIIPIINAALSIVWMLAIMAVLGMPLTLLSYVLPILILVVGAGEDTHLIHEFIKALKDNREPQDAIRLTAERLGMALILTSSTTLLGFAATALSDLPILWNFGIAAVIGLSVRFVCTVLLVPSFLRVFSGSFAKVGRKAQDDRFSRFLARTVVKFAVPRAGIVILLVAITTAGALYASLRIKSSNDLMSFLDPRSAVVENNRYLSQRLAGLETISLWISGKPGNFNLPRELEAVQNLAAKIETLDGVDSVKSFADIMSRINQQLKGGRPEQFRVPPTSSGIKQMLMFADVSEFPEFVTADLSSIHVRVRTHLSDSADINRLTREIEVLVAATDFALQKYSVTGSSVVVASAVNSIVSTQIWSLGTMSVIMFCLVTLLFLSVRCGFVNLVINLFGIAMVFGLMGILSVPLNVGTCMVAAITLGIAVNDSVHLLVSFNNEARHLKDEYRGIEESLRLEARPIISSSLAVAGGFAVLSFSSFLPVRQFGALSTCVLLVSMCIDLVITPVFFANTRIVTLWDMLGLHLRQSLIKNSPFFRGLNSWQAKKVILASHMETFAAGGDIVREGDTGDTMFVVVSGQVEAWAGPPENRRLLRLMSPGDVFGEVALVCGGERTASVTAKEPTSLLSLDQDSLRAFSRFAPFLASQLFLNIANILGDRLSHKTQGLSRPVKKAGPETTES